MIQKCKEGKWGLGELLFALFFIGMAGYYGWRLFALTPWYDELYTYYYFISRGPVYAAIHWPLPNNHVGYSVLSGILMLSGNSAVALRGISFLASLGTLYLLYQTGRKLLGRDAALIPVFLYAGMNLVNLLAVQGRGYSLVTFCYVLGIWELVHITVEHRDRRSDRVCFGASLVLALWAVPSSVYVVVPLCVTGGILLLVQRNYMDLWKLIRTALISAFCTLLLYGVLWLAIGSNLLTKTEQSAFYGQGHLSIILHAPFQAVSEGIRYMLDTPYIQSVSREGYLSRLGGWLSALLNYYYTGADGLLAVLFVAGTAAAMYRIVRKLAAGDYRKRERSGYQDFIEIYLVCSVLLLPLMLLIQCALPYYRVFSFAGVTVALMLTWLWCQAGKIGKSESSFGKALLRIGSVLSGVLCLVLLCSAGYRAPYSERETALEDAFEAVQIEEADRIAVTDCDQEYLLKYLYDIPEERLADQPEDADMIVLDRYLFSENGEQNPDAWKLYTDAEQLAGSRVLEDMTAVYENERFVVFEK